MSACRDVVLAVRRRHLEGAIFDRCGPVLPDDDAGRDYLEEILRLTRDDQLHRKAERLAPWMAQAERIEVVSRIAAMPTDDRISSSAQLGKRLRFTSEERERLKAWQIRPHDYTDEDMASLAKEKKRLREAKRRRKSGVVSREEYIANSLSRIRPWEAEGVSRRTWERRRKKRVASPCHPANGSVASAWRRSETLQSHAVATTSDSGHSKRPTNGRITTRRPTR